MSKLKTYKEKKDRFDPRAEKLGRFAGCPNQGCHRLNSTQFTTCWACGLPLVKATKSSLLGLYEGTGRLMLSKRRATEARDYARKNAKDLLQPYQYDKQQRKYVKNPDFVKAWGDPEKIK